MDRSLLDEVALERSAVVANNAMNRERGLAGVNSYTKDLGFNPLAVLRLFIDAHGAASWLDICCGSARAIIQAAEHRVDGLRLSGVDLVDYFDKRAERLSGLTLTTASIASWEPGQTFDLITCVHGLHYIGDKLGVLTRVLTWLTPGGTFAAHLDLANIQIDGEADTQALKRLMRTAGIQYDTRRRLITCHGPRELSVPYAYLGADDKAGANFTGQPAVNSHYSAYRRSPIG